MPGNLRSRGCATCLKRKKKCDEVKPTCGLCSRLGIECVGNGVKRWKFMPFQDDAGSSGMGPLPMSRTPSNETTSLAAALVHALEVQDVRYNIRTFGGKLMSDLPSQLGTNSELDTTVAAVVALYTARQSHRPKVKALKRYGEALSAASRALEKQNEPAIIRMQTVMMLFICQVFVDRRQADQHRIMVVRVFRDSVLRGTTGSIEPNFRYGLCQIAVWASLMDPSLDLGPWFWQILSTCSATLPVKHYKGTWIRSLEVSTMAEAATYLKAPARHIAQLWWIYDLIQGEKPRVRQLNILAAAAANAPTGAEQAAKLHISCLLAFAALLGLEAIINHVLRHLAASDGNGVEERLVTEARVCLDDVIQLAGQGNHLRPFGSSFLPDMLNAVWGATMDVVEDETGTMESILRDYDKDLEGADYIAEAKYVQRRLQMLVAGGGA